jgi:hypothetical protein
VVAQRYKRDVALSSSNDLHSTFIITDDRPYGHPGSSSPELTSTFAYLFYNYTLGMDLSFETIKHQSKERSLAG